MDDHQEPFVPLATSPHFFWCCFLFVLDSAVGLSSLSHLWCCDTSLPPPSSLSADDLASYFTAKTETLGGEVPPSPHLPEPAHTLCLATVPLDEEPGPRPEATCMPGPNPVYLHNDTAPATIAFPLGTYHYSPTLPGIHIDRRHTASLCTLKTPSVKAAPSSCYGPSPCLPLE